MTAYVQTVTHSSDADLLRQALAGDERAFIQIYERLKGGVFRYAFYMSNSRTAAEEVTQEVFIALLREGHRFRADRGDLGAFVFGIARNMARRIERRERPYQPLPEDRALGTSSQHLLVGSESVSGQLIRNELTERVQAAIASLPDHYRQPVVLCDLCELSYEEAAARLDCSIGTIRSRLNRAHSLLAKKLKSLKSSQPEISPTGTEGCLI